MQQLGIAHREGAESRIGVQFTFGDDTDTKTGSAKRNVIVF